MIDPSVRKPHVLMTMLHGSTVQHLVALPARGQQAQAVSALQYTPNANVSRFETGGHKMQYLLRDRLT